MDEVANQEPFLPSRQAIVDTAFAWAQEQGITVHADLLSLLHQYEGGELDMLTLQAAFIKRNLALRPPA